MIVVSDTSPLNYLVRLDHLDVFPTLYGQVLIPEAVAVELAAPGNPPALRALAAAPPLWLTVRHAPAPDQSLRHLDLGEREAIALAQHLGAHLLLCDDRRGRLAAEACRVRVAGTLAVLEDAATAGLLELEPVIRRLITSTNFRASDELVNRILLRHARRRLPPNSGHRR